MFQKVFRKSFDYKYFLVRRGWPEKVIFAGKTLTITQIFLKISFPLPCSKYILMKKFKTFAFGIGGHWSATSSIESKITNTVQKSKNGKCVQGRKRKSVSFADETIQAKRLGIFFKKREKFLLRLLKNQLQMHLKSKNLHWNFVQEFVAQLFLRILKQFCVLFQM